MGEEFEVGWKNGNLLIDRFYDNDRNAHYRVYGCKSNGDGQYSSVVKKERKSCKRFLAGRNVKDIEGKLLVDNVLGKRIHFK